MGSRGRVTGHTHVIEAFAYPANPGKLPPESPSTVLEGIVETGVDARAVKTHSGLSSLSFKSQCSLAQKTRKDSWKKNGDQTLSQSITTTHHDDCWKRAREGGIGGPRR